MIDTKRSQRALSTATL